MQLPAVLPGRPPPISNRTSMFRSIIRYNSDVPTSTSYHANSMFILGMGFVGQSVGADLKTKGWVVGGTCTSPAKQKKLEDSGFNAFVFDANQPQSDILDVLNYHTHLLITIPPVVGIGDPMLQCRELLASRLRGGNLQWLSYISSTSVYGDCGGGWVDEDYPARPISESARARLAAELAWLKLGSDLDVSAQVFRCGGIYGPGRSAIDTLIKKDALSMNQKMRSSKQYTSRIHVADICQALNASIESPSPGSIYNVVDDNPAPRVEVFAFARSLVEKKWPGHVQQCTVPEAVESIIAPEGYRGGKRVSNARLKKELGVKLLHPTYRSGLQSIIEQMENPFMQKSSGSSEAAAYI